VKIPEAMKKKLNLTTPKTKAPSNLPRSTRKLRNEMKPTCCTYGKPHN